MDLVLKTNSVNPSITFFTWNNFIRPRLDHLKDDIIGLVSERNSKYKVVEPYGRRYFKLKVKITVEFEYTLSS